jgi:hypothetical protein
LKLHPLCFACLEKYITASWMKIDLPRSLETIAVLDANAMLIRNLMRPSVADTKGVPHFLFFFQLIQEELQLLRN